MLLRGDLAGTALADTEAKSTTPQGNYFPKSMPGMANIQANVAEHQPGRIVFNGGTSGRTFDLSLAVIATEMPG